MGVSLLLQDNDDEEDGEVDDEEDGDDYEE